MPFMNSLRHFPIVKMIPLSCLDGDKNESDKGVLGSLFASAMVSLKDIESLWNGDHDAAELKDKFQKLYYQLDSLKRYCESDNETPKADPGTA